MANTALSHHHLLLFSFLIPLLLSMIAPTHQVVPLGSSLSTLDENASSVSPSGEFALGFHHLPNNSLFLLAICFQKIPQRTVVWSANNTFIPSNGDRLFESTV
ncbi:hypothetical protein AAC387_Pa02g1140 [Persea americana]